MGNLEMVVSQNRGTPGKTPKYYSPYDGDPQKGYPAFSETSNEVLEAAHVARVGKVENPKP